MGSVTDVTPCVGTILPAGFWGDPKNIVIFTQSPCFRKGETFVKLRRNFNY